MTVKIYDALKLEDVLIMGTHNYHGSTSYLRVKGHDLVFIGLDDYDDTIDDPELKRELLEHPDHFTLEGKPITEVSIHRFLVDVEENGDEVFQIEVILSD